MKTKVEVIQELFEIGAVKQFSDIFRRWKYPKTTLAKALRINNARIDGYIDNPERFSQYQVQQISDFFGVPYADIQTAIDAQIQQHNAGDSIPR